MHHRHGYSYMESLSAEYNSFGESVTSPLRYGFICTCSACNTPPVLKENAGSGILKPSDASEIMRRHLAQLRTLWQRGGNKVFEM